MANLVKATISIVLVQTVLFAGNATLRVDGTALVNFQRKLQLLDTRTKQLTPVGQAEDAAFSYGGKHIAYIANGAIHIMKNDGTGKTKICDLYDSKVHDVIPNWIADGYIYWSEWRDDVYRVNVNTKKREVHCTIKYPSKSSSQDGGTGSTGIVRLMVSQDGKRGSAISKGLGYVFALDLENAKLLSKTDGGCQGVMTTDGNLILHSITQGDHFPSGITSGNQCARIEDFGTRETRGYVYAPDQPGTGKDSKARYFRTSRNSPDHAVAFCRVVYQGKAVLYEISSGDYLFLGGSDSNKMTAYDFWLGSFDNTATPAISLDKSTVAFAAADSDPAPQTVTVSNSGSGTLGAVTVGDDADWLTVTVSGSGNIQTLTNTCSIAGLAPGAYHATVTVEGGGADLATNYAVTLNLGTTVAAPDGISAQSPNDGEAIVSWSDNSDNETGFVVERSTDRSTWTDAGQTGANTTELTDHVGDNTYYYRVKAIRDSESSGYSQIAEVVVSSSISVTLMSPAGGEEFAAGSEQMITWNSVATGAVKLSYSVDNGKSWIPITADGTVKATDPEWEKYPWTVPDAPTATALVKVEDYLDETVHSISGAFSITEGSPVLPGNATAGHRAPGLYGVTVLPGNRGLRFDIGSPSHSRSSITVCGLNGKHITSIRVPGNVRSFAWRPASRLGAGSYVVRRADADGDWGRTFMILIK